MSLRRPTLSDSLHSWRLSLAVGLVVVSAAAVVAFVSPNELADGVKRCFQSPGWMATFVGLYTLAFALRALAWRVLLGVGSIWSLHGVLQASLVLNHALPVKAGEVARPLMARGPGISLGAATTSSVVARVIDVCVLASLAVLLLPFSNLGAGDSLRMVGPALLLVSSGALAIMVLRSGAGVPIPAPAKAILEDLRQAFRTTSTRQYMLAAAITLPSWALEASAVYATARVLGVDLPVHAAIGVSAFTILFQVFHFTPGGIGIYEGSMSAALVSYGVDLDSAVVLATTTHALKFAYAFTVGVLFSVTIPGVASRLSPLARLRGSASTAKDASRFEVIAARAWNVLNEGKPFTLVFVGGVLLALAIPHAGDAGYWARWSLGILCIAPLALVFFLESSPEEGKSIWHFRKGLLALLIVGAGAALLLTFIRGAWFALVVGVLLLGMLRGSLRYRQLLLTIPLIAGGVLVAFSPALDRLEQVADPTSTLFGRIEVWKLAADWITTSPLVFLSGLGMKAFEYFYILQAAPRVAGLYWRRESFLIGNRPHNEILGFWLDVGLIGLVAFIAALVIVIRQAWRIFRGSEDQPLRLFALAFIVGAAGIIFGAMGDNVFSQPSVASYFWIMAGLIMAITKHMMPASDAASP